MKSLKCLFAAAAFICAVPSISNATLVYRVDANASSAPALHIYDSDTDTWTEKAALPASNTTQLATDGNTLYALPEDGNIYSYDTNADSWTLVLAGPPDAIGRHAVSMFETYGGEFFWGDDSTTTLHYTVNGVWTSTSTPQPISSGAGIDGLNGIIYIRINNELGFMAFDTATGTFTQVCDLNIYVGENSRVGVYYDGLFYSRTWSGNLFGIDVSTCVATDTGVALSTEHASTDVDAEGNIYLNGYSGTQTVFEVFSTQTNTVTALADAPLYSGNAHPSLAIMGFAAPPPPPPEPTAPATPVPTLSEWSIITLGAVLGLVAGVVVRRRVA